MSSSRLGWCWPVNFSQRDNCRFWDLRPDAEKWCHPCSSAAERIVRHNGRCPIPVKQKALREQRAAAARQAIEDRSRREREEGEQAAAAEAAENESGAEEQEGDASTAESDFDFPELAGPAAAVPVAPPPTASRTSTTAKPPAVARVAKRRMPPAVSSTAVSRSKRGASRGTKRVSLAASRQEREDPEMSSAPAGEPPAVSSTSAIEKPAVHEVAASRKTSDVGDRYGAPKTDSGIPRNK